MMQFDLASLWAQALESVQDPRAGARRILALDLPLGTAALALVIVALLTALIAAMVSLMAMRMGAGEVMGAQLSPLQWVGLQTLGLFLAALAMAYVGRWFGGYGSLAQAISLLAWAEFIILIVQIVQVMLMFILPPLSAVLALFGVALTFYLVSHFIAELHGFASAVKVFFGILATGFALIMTLAVLAAVFIGPIGG
jgi:hypothetical protein